MYVSFTSCFVCLFDSLIFHFLFAYGYGYGDCSICLCSLPYISSVPLCCTFSFFLIHLHYSPEPTDNTATDLLLCPAAYFQLCRRIGTLPRHTATATSEIPLRPPTRFGDDSSVNMALRHNTGLDADMVPRAGGGTPTRSKVQLSQTQDDEQRLLPSFKQYVLDGSLEVPYISGQSLTCDTLPAREARMGSE